MLNGLSLFTGYAGIDIALSEWVRPITYCDIEPYAQAILLSRMEDGSIPCAPIWDDVKTLPGRQLRGHVDIIYGGSPCQGFSEAGLGRGMDDERSGLIREFIRLAEEIEPTFLFIENVPAIRTKGLNEFIRRLSDLGYDSRWTRVSAEQVGANHQRERFFLLAKKISHPMCPRLRRKTDAAKKENNKRERQDNGRAERWATVSDWWAPESPFHGVDDGTPFRMDRVKACGNGVVPLQVKTAFEVLAGIKK